MAAQRPQIQLTLVIIAISAMLASAGVKVINQALLSSEAATALSGGSAQGVLAAFPAAADANGLRVYARTDVAAPYLQGPLHLQTVVPATEAVTDVLRVWPLAGTYWLRLAEIRAASGADIQSVIAAHQLSVLVAPFDGEMMLARQVLDVQLWDVLSVDEQRTVVNDLVSVWNSRPPDLTAKLRQATAGLSTEGRKSLKAELKARSSLGDQAARLYWVVT